MIIEPTPTNPRSPLRRVARLLGLVTPVVLLVAVIGGAVLGRAAEPPRPSAPPSAAPAPAGSAPAPDPAAPVVNGADQGIDAVPAGGVPPFPTVAADLAVLTVPEALGALAEDGPGRVVAVAGYLAIPSAPTDCDDAALGPLGPLCVRNGILAEQPWAVTGAGSVAGLGRHLHPRFPVGVGLPDGIAATTLEAGGPPLRAVVLGRFESGGENCKRVFSCSGGFVADRVAWAAGAALPQQTVVDAGVDGNPPEWMLRNRGLAEVAAIGWSGTILVSALVRPSTVTRLDAEAGAALAKGPMPAGLVWYVRGLETGYDPIRYPLGRSRPRLAWVVLDDVTGTVMARRSIAQLPE